MVKNIVRALRLPFLSASVLPFIFGSLVNRQNFNLANLLFGLVVVMATHLSANLINDYADSKSGADWQDKNFYRFFGGSKLIQENVFPEKFYLKASLFFAAISGFSILILSLLLKSFMVLLLYLAIIILSWQYSRKPLQLSYRRLGEIFIFILFGPALVMGGYFIQARIFPDFKSFMLSIPFGLLTTGILFANEVPDFADDKKAGKLTWVSFTGKKAFILYFLLVFIALLFITLNMSLGYLGPIALFSFLVLFPGLKAAKILKKDFGNKAKLIESSKLTITIQTIVSIILILDMLL